MKKIAAFIGAVALLATGAASMGCLWVFGEEPNSIKSIVD